MPEKAYAGLFELFNEIGIIEQLSRTSLEAHLPLGLIAPHFSVLNHLVRLGDARAPIEIARAFQVPKTTMTHTLKGLEALHLIDMRPNPDDGRSKLVFITPAGRALRDRTIAVLAPDFDRIAVALDVVDLQKIVPTLKELREFLDANKNRAPPRSD